MCDNYILQYMAIITTIPGDDEGGEGGEENPAGDRFEGKRDLRTPRNPNPNPNALIMP